MSRLFGHVWAIEIGARNEEGKRYELMDMKFTAHQNGSSKPTTCDITIYNPDSEMVGMLGNKNELVKLYAGYIDSGAVQVAQGVVVSGSIQDRRLSAESEVTFQISKGREISTATTFSRSWSSTTASEVIEYIRKELGLVADVITLAKNPTYSRGYAIQGSPLEAIGSIVRDCGCQYTINDGRLRIWPIGVAARILIDVWAADSGLMEVQSQGSGSGKKIAATALLRPSLRPGDVIKLESQQYTGQVLAKEVTHEGDTFGGSWYTSIEGVPYE